MKLTKLYNFADTALDRMIKEIVDVYNRFRFGGTADYAEFEEDGTLHFVGEATVWNDINISGSVFRSIGTAPLGTYTPAGTSLVITSFTGTGGLTAAAQGSFELLHDYKEGTDIRPHVHWCATSTAAGNVKWNLEYAWLNRDGVLTSTTTISAVEAASGVAGKEQHTPLPVIAGAGKHIGSRFQFRLFRDPSQAEDTYTDAAAVFDFGLHYECDTVGSREYLNK